MYSILLHAVVTGKYTMTPLFMFAMIEVKLLMFYLLQISQQECAECASKECREEDAQCDCECDCESQSPVRVVRRPSRPCSTWALAAICTVTVGLCVVLAGLLYVATRSVS